MNRRTGAPSLRPPYHRCPVGDGRRSIRYPPEGSPCSIPAALVRNNRWTALMSLLLFAFAFAFSTEGTAETNRSQRGFRYIHDQNADVPWSMHIVKVQRGHPSLEFQTTLGRTNEFGMSLISEQARSTASEQGQPIAAINGDFYTNTETHPGRPRDLQIRHGELLTDPDGHACFWIDPDGTPRMTNVQSRLRVVWPNGKVTPFGLNEPRGSDAVVLYTHAIGPTTRTGPGLELLLAPSAGSPWIPLRPGLHYTATVRSVVKDGNTALPKDALVLSLGPRIASELPEIRPGTQLSLLTETIPNLAGVQTAIGGGPTLLANGEIMKWNWINPRHPRSAIGWNDDSIFLVEVDGRQAGLSAGMSFPELAAYMLRLGCRNAMNLDGGGSSTLWMLGNVINSPSEGQERPAANALVLVEKRARSKDPAPLDTPRAGDEPGVTANEPPAESLTPPTASSPTSAPGRQARFPEPGTASPEGAKFLPEALLPIALEIEPTAIELLRSHPREAVRATLQSGHDVPVPVSLRLKGSTGSFRTIDDKPSWTITFTADHPDQRLHGLRRIYLNNAVEDPTYLHEQLGSEIFRAQSIPAPRVGHARVRLNGKPLGIYVLKEGFTVDFLARHFARSDGILCDNDEGSDVDQPLHRNLPPGIRSSVADQTHLASDLAEAAKEPDLQRRWERFQAVLDLDRFLTFTVLEVMLGHRDGYGLARNNFRLYRDPGAGRWTFLPDGMDQLFGLASFPWKPHMSGLVAAALLETPDGRRAYASRFVERMDDVFRNPAPSQRVERLAAALRPHLSWTERIAFDREVRGLQERMILREQDLRKQITETRNRAKASSEGPSASRTPSQMTPSL